MKGQFWVVDGLDGSGKTGLMDKIKAFLTDHRIPFIWSREPGGTPFAEMLRDGLKFGFYGLGDYELSPMTQTMLFNAARVDHIEKVIKPHMAQGKIVLCDRYKDSTFAYQGGAGGINASKLTTIHDLVCGFNPDMVFMMDGDPKVFAERMAGRGQPDKLDKLQLDKADEMRDVYQYRASLEPDVYRVIDATQSEEQVWAQVLPHLMEKLNQLKQRPTA
jgi:dTMP kinase